MKKGKEGEILFYFSAYLNVFLRLFLKSLWISNIKTNISKTIESALFFISCFSVDLASCLCQSIKTVCMVEKMVLISLFRKFLVLNENINGGYDF